MPSACYFGGLLVHVVHFVREPRSDSGTLASRHVAGIRAGNAPAFVLAEFVGALAALVFFGWLLGARTIVTSRARSPQ